MYLNDYKVGMEFDLTPFSFSKEEIKEFAKTYDPRSIHIDDEAGQRSRFKGIISSGMMTLIYSWADWVHTEIDSEGVIAGIGLNNVRWLKPVYPDTILNGKVVVLDVRPSSNGKTGTVTSEFIVTTQEGEEVMRLESLGLVATSKDHS